MIELRIFPDYHDMSQAAALWMANIIQTNPESNLVLALGNSPEGTYEYLAHMVENKEISFQKCRIFQLDEYIGLSSTDRRLLFGWLKRSCLDPLDIPTSNVVRLPSDPPDFEQACRNHDRLINQFGIDAMILGLGPNGHLGFNEPGSPEDSLTRRVNLSYESIASNSIYWGGQDQVPSSALTMGLGNLSHAHQSLLVVNGIHKQNILRQVLLGEITPEVPASFMRNWSDVIVMADYAAASEMQEGYY